MAPTARLTKRQKKGIAFRERKRIKDTPADVADNSEDEHDVPNLEHSVLADSAKGLQGRQVSEEEVFVGKRKTREKGDEAKGVVVAGKKRERKASEDKEKGGEPGEPKPKRRKGSLLGGIGEPVEDGVRSGEVEKEGEKVKQRFILFLGNLKYTTTLEAIRAHFSVCGVLIYMSLSDCNVYASKVPPPTVRLLTPKPSTKSSTKPVVKSKGCAFLEFTHRGALQQGLKLHHSQLDGRQVNVELTAGGGGKGDTRLKKLKERNKELEGQRRKRQSAKMDAQSEGAQRFSATSGTEQTLTHSRTWTIGDVEEKDTHRGGQKHKRRSGKRGTVKDFRTGVNAIPVG